MSAAPGVVYFTQPLTGAQSFACSKMRCDMSVDACKTAFLSGRYLSCKGCSTGQHHSGRAPRVALDIAHDTSIDRHGRADARNSLHCVRCGANSLTSTNHCRFRLVHSSWCICCYNRGLERVRGFNSKGIPVSRWLRWRHLVVVLLTIRRADGTERTLKPTALVDRAEADAYIERRFPGATIARYDVVSTTNAAAER